MFPQGFSSCETGLTTAHMHKEGEGSELPHFQVNKFLSCWKEARGPGSKTMDFSSQHSRQPEFPVPVRSPSHQVKCVWGPGA